jgi:hypothetical protein
LGREKRQRKADEDALHYIVSHSSGCMGEEESVDEEKDAYSAV